jgi:hypothetical protein
MSQRAMILSVMSLCLSGLAASGQLVNAAQQVTLQGLRSSAGYGSFTAAAYGPDGSLYLLLDEHNGLRILKTDAGAANVLAQANAGAAGDSGVAIAVDSSGSVYVAGTSSSGVLSGTSTAAYPRTADSSINSFIAKYDANLNLAYLTFLGAGRMAVSGLSVSGSSVFVTGTTFSSAFPVTVAGIQQRPANGSAENGFVESFSVDGSTVQYATYLTGAGGNTVPTAIVADAGGNAYVTGSTAASGFPTIAALQPEILLAPGNANSGFLTKLNATGSAFIFSTFVAGTGITGMAVDASASSLLLTGNVSLGQFPVATVAMPLTSTSYQTLLRIPEDGQSVTGSVLLTAGSTSYVSAGQSGDAWVSGTESVPLFPGITPPDYNVGDSYLLHVTAPGVIDQTLRFGGVPKKNLSYGSLTSTVAAPAIAGSVVTLAGTITATLSPSSLTTQTFELPAVGTPNAALPSTLRDVIPSATACSASICSGSGGFLAQVSTASAAPSLAVSTDDLPNLTVRNLGSAAVAGLTISATGYSVATNCGSSLAPSSLCNIALNGSGPGVLTLSGSNAVTRTVSLPATTFIADALVIGADELDFGIVSAASGVVTRTIGVTNLSGQAQTFVSTKDGATSAYALMETSSTCASGGATGMLVLAANSNCIITLGLSASNISSNDGAVNTAWTIGSRAVSITGFVQAAALSISTTEIDFGTFVAGGSRLPRYLYLSNNSSAVVSHAAVALLPDSPFTVTDNCPLALQPMSVCSMLITYQPRSTTSSDAQTVSLDEGIRVLLTGQARPALTVSGALVNPSLSVSPSLASFPSAVTVTGVSTTSLPVVLTNSGSAAFALATAVAGDFIYVSNCPATLSAGSSCTLLVSFAPSQPGLRQGLLSITAGSGFAPQYVALSGTGTALLPTNNGVMNLGQTLVGEPIVNWYKVQQSLPSLSATVSDPTFGVALVTEAGSGHGTLPAQAFSPTATLACASCWLGVQYLSQTAQSSSATLMLSTVPTGNRYMLDVTAAALPVQGLVLTPATQDFGTVTIGSTSTAMTLSLASLLTASTAVTVQSVSVSGDFALATNLTGGASCNGLLAATASCFVEVSFTPTALGDRSGVLTVVTSGGTVTAALSGYGLASAGLSISPSALIFADVPGGSSTAQMITLTNSGKSDVAIGSVSSSDPSFASTTACSALAVGASCGVTVVFSPQTALVEATLFIPVTTTINGQVLTASYLVPLTGAYTAQNAGLEILPAEANYGATATGGMGQTRAYTLNNLSGKQLIITLSMARQFPLSMSPACATIVAGGSCGFSVTFAPVTTGAQTGTVLAEGVSVDGLVDAQALGYLQGYGVGAAALTITGGTIPYSPLMFGQVTSGQSVQQVLTLTNSGSGPLTIRRVSSALPFLSTTDCGATIAVGASCGVTITYAPTYELPMGSASGGTRSDLGSLSVESDAVTSPDFIAMAGLVLPVISSTPASSAALATYQLSNSALTFANTQVGNVSAMQTITLKNTGTTTVRVLGLLVSTDFAESSTCGTLLPGDVCSIRIGFTPTDANNEALRTGVLEIQTDATNSLEYISLVGGSTAAPLVFGQEALNFGAVHVGSSQSLNLTVSNQSAASVTFEGLSAGGVFTVMNGTCPAVGSLLAGSSSCTLVVTFAPVAAGSQSGTLSLTNDATQLPLTVALSGTGVVAAVSETFVLTVNGGNSATMTVASGSPASFSLVVTPLNGYIGNVALTCVAVNPGRYANCSLLAPLLTLNANVIGTTATISTVSAALRRGGGSLAGLLALLPLTLLRRKRPRSMLAASLLASALLALCMNITACGSGAVPVAASGSRTVNTPAGTYQYLVTASATSGAVISSTVTLNLIVQ